MFVVPALTPYTTPVAAPTVPTAVVPLLHVPELPVAVASVNVIVKPEHTVPGPVIVPAVGEAFTVMIDTVVAVLPQPVPVSVYVIAVVPAATP